MIKALFIAAAVAIGFAIMWFFTGGELTLAWWGAPLVFAAESVFLGLIYCNFFLDGHEEEEAHEEEARHTRPVAWHAQPQPQH